MAKLSKNRGRSRFFGCYKPVIFNDDTTIIKLGHVYNPKDLSSLKRVKSHEKLNSMLGKDYAKIFRTNRKENVFGRNFSALKNVFSDTSLGKKGQRKEPKGSFGPYKKLSSKFEKIFHSMNETKSSSKDLSNITNRMSRSSTDDFSLFTTSTASSSFSSSSSSSSSPSSSCSSSRSSSQRKQFSSFQRSKSANNIQVYHDENVTEKEIALRYNKNVGTYSLLICLLVMIFCGKIFAIICIASWFYFAPCCFKRIDSDEYKKNM